MTGQPQLGNGRRFEQSPMDAIKIDQTVIEAITDPVLLLDPSGTILLLNTSAAERLGGNANEMVGTCVYNYLPPEIAAERQAHLEAICRSGRPDQFEDQRVGRFFLHTLYPVFDEQGKVKMVAIYARDVTDYRQALASLQRSEAAEREHRLLAESLCDITRALVSTLERDQVLDQILINIERIVPYDTASILLIEGEVAQVVRCRGFAQRGLDEQHILHSRIPVKSFIHMGRIGSDGHPVIIPDTYANPNWLKLPLTRWIRSYIGIPILSHDKTIGFIGLSSATPNFYTPLHATRLQALANQAAIALHNAQLYSELQTTLARERSIREQLVQAEKLSALGRMVASVTHEFNNPLQTIQNCIFLVRQEVTLSTSANANLNIALSEIERLSSLVSQLRTVYQPAPKKQLQPVSINTLLENVGIILAPQLKHYGIQWQYMPTPAEPTVRGIEHQLKQVFLNIGLNAIEAMHPTGGTLTVTLSMDHKAQEVGITFRDTGPGIPPEILSSLFDPFFTTKETGSGLGLFICYDIVQRHGGRITVESQPGQGAAFTVWLPLEYPPDPLPVTDRL